MSKSCFRRIMKAAFGSRLMRDRKGGAAIMFAISAPVALLAITGVMSYGYALQYRADIQSAVDGAVVTATQALAANASADASTIATDYFKANAPAQALSRGTLNIYSGDFNNAVTVKADYSGSVPTLLSDVLGYSSLPVGATSAAQVMLGSTSGGGSGGGGSSGGGSSGGGSGGGQTGGTTGGGAACPGALCFSGSGYVFGDPHIVSPTGADFYMDCTTPSGSWYNMLSDAGIEVNVSCLQSTYYSGANYINAFNVLLNGHTLFMTAPPANYTKAGGSYSFNQATAWFGGVTIDGTYYPPGTGCTSSHPCTTTYLDGMVKVVITDLVNLYRGDNWVYIYDKGYTVAMTFNQIAFGQVNFIASNVGAAGPPGGMWGQTLSGLADSKGSDFILNGPNVNTSPASTSLANANAAAYQYYWTWPASGSGNVVGSSSTTHLVQ